MFCGVLRNSARFSWLDREVYNQTLVLQQVIVDLAKETPLSLQFTRSGLGLGEDENLDELPKAVRQFHAMARRKSIRELVFKGDITAGEVMALLRLLQNKSSLVYLEDRKKFPNIEIKHDMGEGSIELPDEDGYQSVAVAGQSRFRRLLDEGEKQGDEVRDMVTGIASAIDAIAEARQKKEKSPAAAKASTPLGDLAHHLGQATEVTLILASLRAHDSYTYDHSINVGLLSIALAKAIGWKGSDLTDFGVAALIHDVGKLYTPLEVLNKPGRFTPQEWVVMKRHPGDGAEILREAGVGNELAPRIALEHHTNPDGTGYPPLPNEELHTGSKIVKIADCYDAFTTIRPYRSQARPFEVLKMLRKQAGTQFDAELVEVFCEMMGVYPIGSVVKLRSGNIGLVVQTNQELRDRPVVRVLQDERGRKPKKTTLIDLAWKSGEEFADEVIECIDPVIRNIQVGRYV
jgi:putative nucleotidyltransferase with HDIG domain